MFKASAHIRPFIRLPTSTPGPDHFTANPSLLHHLPHNGGNALVSQAQNSTQASGASGSTGRAGYGGSAGSGGYTGHARAFLSLPQTASVDPSSTLSNDDNNQQSPSSPAQRSLLFKHRLSKRTRIINLDDHRVVRREIEARAGGQQVTVQEIEEKPVSSRSRGRRSSIVFPARPAISHSTSSRDVWQVGIPRRTQLGVRALSTRPDEAITSTSTSATRVLGQPNRVLMDLAGRDLPGRRLGMVRRNSTAAVERASLDLPPMGLDQSSMEHPGINGREDGEIVRAIHRARDRQDIEMVHRLISHYRSPRSNSPFGEQAIGDPALAEQFPLPSNYSLKTYNTCLGALVNIRKSGQSIAPILELYNEILERGLVPTATTYGLVIRSLAVRETEVADAAGKWAEEKRWSHWRAERLGDKSFDAAEAERKDQLFESYAAEGNLSSALKLFRAATMIYSDRNFDPSVYGTLLQAMVSQSHPDVSALTQLFNRAKRLDDHGSITMHKYLLQAFGRARDVDEVERAWKELTEARKDPAAMVYLRQRTGNVDARIEGHISEMWDAAIEAFVAAGQPARAFEIFGEIMQEKSDSIDLARPPPPSVKTCGTLLVSLAKHGHADLAMEWYDKIRSSGFLEDSSLGRLTLEHVGELVDSLVLAGQYPAASRTILDFIAANPEFSSESGRHTLIKKLGRVYLALVTEGKDYDGMMAIENAQPLPLDLPVVKRHLAVLAKQGLYSDLSAVLDAAAPSPVGERQAKDLATLARGYIAFDLPLAPLLSLIRAFARHRIHAPQSSEALLAKYSSERTQELQLGPDAWFRLIEAATTLPKDKVEDGDFDELLQQLTDDLAAVNTENHDYLYKIQNHQVITLFAQRLAHRFSVDRATQMLAKPFGQTRAEQLTAPPPPLESKVVVEDAPATEHNLRIDRSLSAAVDRFTLRNPPITPMQAYDLVRQGLTQSTVPHPEVLCHLIDHLARQGDEAKVQELYSLAQVVLSTLIRPNQQSHNWHLVEDAMLIANCHLGHLEQAGLHRARILEAGLAPTADAYATMIASSKDTTDDALVARELFDESQAMGVRPHLYLYNTIISKLSKARKAELALELFMHMKEANIRPSSVTYGAVINACCRVGDAQSAETLFEEMSSQPNFHAKVPPFNTMMQFYLQTQPNRERVLHYHAELQQARVPPSAHTYKLLLDTYATLPPIDLEAMEGVFSQLQADRRVQVQGTHYASLIVGYGIHDNDLSKSLQVFETIPRQIVKQEAVVWEAILNVISQRGSIDQLESMRQKMIESGSQPTAYVYNVLISGYAKNGQIDKSREIFESMGDSITGVAAPNNHPTLLTSSGHVKPSTTTPTTQGIVYREPSTYESMIRAEIAFGQRERAVDVLGRMEERGYPLAVYMRARAALDEVKEE